MVEITMITIIIISNRVKGHDKIYKTEREKTTSSIELNIMKKTHDIV